MSSGPYAAKEHRRSCREARLATFFPGRALQAWDKPQNAWSWSLHPNRAQKRAVDSSSDMNPPVPSRSLGHVCGWSPLVLHKIRQAQEAAFYLCICSRFSVRQRPPCFKSANNHRDRAPWGRHPRDCRRFWAAILVTVVSFYSSHVRYVAKVTTVTGIRVVLIAVLVIVAFETSYRCPILNIFAVIGFIPILTHVLQARPQNHKGGGVIGYNPTYKHYEPCMNVHVNHKTQTTGHRITGGLQPSPPPLPAPKPHHRGWMKPLSTRPHHRGWMKPLPPPQPHHRASRSTCEHVRTCSTDYGIKGPHFCIPTLWTLNRRPIMLK